MGECFNIKEKSKACMSVVVVSNVDGGISFVFSPMWAIESWHCVYNTHLAFSFVSIRYGCLLLDWDRKCQNSVRLTGACTDAKMSQVKS